MTMSNIREDHASQLFERPIYTRFHIMFLYQVIVTYGDLLSIHMLN